MVIWILLPNMTRKQLQPDNERAFGDDSGLRGGDPSRGFQFLRTQPGSNGQKSDTPIKRSGGASSAVFETTTDGW